MAEQANRLQTCGWPAHSHLTSTSSIASRLGISKRLPEITEAGKTVADMKSEAWQLCATKETRDACEEELEQLNAHGKKHGW
jgi:hypothetical protein